jgi:N-methylhydantoinase B
LSAAIDPVTLEILWTRITSIVDEAAKVIVRTAFSTLSTEANDFACVVTDEAGRSIAQNTGSIPSFIGTLPATVRHFLDAIGAGSMRSGDVLITNNPWQGTGHLNDICVVKPVFHGERLVAFAATTSHVPDIGGRIRSVEPREIYEEGFHIPLMHLVRAGEPDKSLLQLLRTNVRTPDQTEGDVWAQVGALDLMERRLHAVLEDYRLENFRALADELFDRAEAAMREAIRSIPEGTYESELESDGLEEPFRFKLALTVKDGTIEADYTGTSPQQPRAINCVMAYTFAMTAYAVKCALLPNLPNNDGMFRPIRVKAPEGSIVNPRMPASCGGRAATGHYVPVLVFRALHQAIPDRVMAAAGSPLWIFTFAGRRTDGSGYATVLFFNGGLGGRAGKDGHACLSWPSNISSTPVEVAERASPVFFHHKRLAPGTGGPGAFRGGLGQEVLIELEGSSEVAGTFITERVRVPAPALGGGDPGTLGEVRINDAPIDTRLQHILRPGDRVLLRTPGGGGYGSPGDRSGDLLEHDRVMGYARE